MIKVKEKYGVCDRLWEGQLASQGTWRKTSHLSGDGKGQEEFKG